MSLKNEAKCFLVFLILFLVGHQASSQEVFSAFIILNGQPLNDPVWVEHFAEEERLSLVHMSEITDYLKVSFSEELFNQVLENLDEEKRIRFEDLNKIGIKTDLDLNSLNLALTVKAEDKKLTEVQVSGQSKNSEVKNLYKTAPFSGYINLRASAEFLGNNAQVNAQNVFDRSSLVQLEPVFNLYGVVYESQYIYNENKGDNLSDWRRASSRLVYDDQKKAVRYTAGDLIGESRGFQEINFGMGLSVKKEFTIKPNLFRSSFKKHKFYLENDSKVEIFINGKLVRKMYLNQGPVELSDFPFISGENEVQVRVTDATGKIRNINYSDINDSRILPLGFSDYNFNLLFPRSELETFSLGFGDSVYDYDNYSLNGYYHYGAFRDGVLGVDWQYSERKYLIGAEFLYGQEEGIVKLNLAQSDNKVQNLSGMGLRLEYENLLFRDGALSSFRFLSGLEYKERGFTSLNAEGPNNTEIIARLSVGQNFKNSIRGSLGFSKEWGHVVEGDRTYLTSNFGWTFLKNFDFSSNVRFNIDDRDDSTILFALNWYAPTNDQQFVSTHDPIAKTISTEYTGFPLRGNQNFRTYVGGELNEGSKRALVGMDYFNQRSEVRMAHSSAFQDGNQGTSQSTQLSLGTGVAFTNKSFAVTKPVDNAFVLVSMPDRPKGHSVPIGRGVGSQRGEINRMGPASVTNLAPYFRDRINLDVASLPYGYVLNQEIYSFFPTYRGGVHIRVDVEGEVSLNGRAVFANGSPASYVTGNLFSIVEGGARGEMVGQFFTGGNGVFSVERLEKKKYILVFESDEQEFQEAIVTITKSIGVQNLAEDIVLRLK